MMFNQMFMQPDPLISFEDFIEKVNFYRQNGLLGFFNYAEVTEIIMLPSNSKPINIFSLIIFEEHKDISSKNPVFLNDSRITISEIKNCSFGIYRYFIKIDDVEEELKSFTKNKEWKLSREVLSTGQLIPLLPQFVPANATENIPLNVVLKNNFWNGSYVFELFDTDKKSLQYFFSKPHTLQKLSSEINKFTPIKIASMSDRLGNIIIQIPSNIGAFKIKSDRNDNKTFSFAWRDKIKKRKCQLISASEIDKNVVAFESYSAKKNDSWNTFIGKIPKVDRTYLFDLENKLLLAAATSLTFIQKTDVKIQIQDNEPRVICIPQDKDIIEKKQINLLSTEPLTVEIPDIFSYENWIRNRIYQEEKEDLLKRLEFVQYGLTSNTKEEHERAIKDIHKLLSKYGQKEVWLWDPYLSAKDIFKTLFFNPHFGAKLRALTSKKVCKQFSDKCTIDEWKSQQSMLFNTTGNNYRGINLEFKISYDFANCNFHDRFIIFPDTDNANKEPLAWSLGISVNALGKSHHILQKVAYAQLIADAFQEMWCKVEDKKHLIWKHK